MKCGHMESVPDTGETGFSVLCGQGFTSLSLISAIKITFFLLFVPHFHRDHENLATVTRRIIPF